MRKTRLEKLTIKHNFMFGAVMIDPENCKGFLERVLQIKIDHVEVSLEKSIVYHPEYKGVRWIWRFFWRAVNMKIYPIVM